jgi:hypothetical protein
VRADLLHCVGLCDGVEIVTHVATALLLGCLTTEIDQFLSLAQVAENKSGGCSLKDV